MCGEYFATCASVNRRGMSVPAESADHSANLRWYRGDFFTVLMTEEFCYGGGFVFYRRNTASLSFERSMIC